MISEVLPLTIAATGLSPALDVSAASAIVGIVMPDDWTPAVVTVQASFDGTNFFDVYDGPAGKDLFFNVLPRSFVAINSNRLRGCVALKMRSGRIGAVVPQAAPRTFGVVVENNGTSGGTQPQTGYYGTILEWSDGSGAIALPNWMPSPFIKVDGPHGTLEGGGFRCAVGGPCILSMHGFVLHSWGRWIVFGRRWDGGAIQEFGRIQVNSSTPVLVFFEVNVTLEQGGLLETFISSDFEWSQFSWTSGQMMFLIEAGGSFELAGR